jgi:hypothetical protein
MGEKRQPMVAIFACGVIIRKIRNEFAHSMDIIDFNHPPIASRCRELHYNVFQDQLPPRKAFNRVAFGLAVW